MEGIVSEEHKACYHKQDDAVDGEVLLQPLPHNGEEEEAELQAHNGDDDKVDCCDVDFFGDT